MSWPLVQVRKRDNSFLYDMDPILIRRLNPLPPWVYIHILYHKSTASKLLTYRSKSSDLYQCRLVRVHHPPLCYPALCESGVEKSHSFDCDFPICRVWVTSTRYHVYSYKRVCKSIENMLLLSSHVVDDDTDRYIYFPSLLNRTLKTIAAPAQHPRFTPILHPPT